MADPHHLVILLPAQKQCCVCLGLEQADIYQVEGEGIFSVGKSLFKNLWTLVVTLSRSLLQRSLFSNGVGANYNVREGFPEKHSAEKNKDTN